MARGKHNAKATARRAQQAADRIAALRAEIAAEQEALAVAETELEEVNEIRAELEREVAGRTADTGGRRAALRAEADFLTRAIRDQEDAEADVQEAWGKVWQRATASPGGGQQALEKIMKMIGMPGYLIDTPNGGDLGQALAVQAARGERVYEKAPETPGIADTIHFLLRPELRDARAAAGIPLDPDAITKPTDLPGEQQRVWDEVEAEAARIWNSHASNLSIGSIHAWHPLPVLRLWGDGECGLAEDFGIAKPDQETEVASPAEAEWPLPVTALPAASRERLAASDPATMLRVWKDRYTAAEALAAIFQPYGRSVSSGPRHPRPGYGELLRGIYAKSALGTWSRSELWSEGSPRELGRTAVGLTCAATFWLPAGQTHAFADSEPLDEDDLAELLLPFPQVFLAFAEPLELQPRRAPTAFEAAAMQDLDRAISFMNDKKDKPLNAIVRDLEDPERLAALSVDQVIAFRGARIEGLLLMSDSLGRVEDRFSWCVSVPSGARGSLGRHVLPARLSESRYRPTVENLIAVTAWAKWHEPDTETTIPSGASLRDILDMIDSADFKRDAARTGGGGVRVLNVKATTSRPHEAQDSGRHVAPHVRRGHWRRQRFGPGSNQVKRIRIAPVLVNAHRGAMAQRVYVLPRD